MVTMNNLILKPISSGSNLFVCKLQSANNLDQVAAKKLVRTIIIICQQMEIDGSIQPANIRTK